MRLLRSASTKTLVQGLDASTAHVVAGGPATSVGSGYEVWAIASSAGTIAGNIEA